MIVKFPMKTSRYGYAVSIWVLMSVASTTLQAEPDTLTLPAVVAAGFARYPELPLSDAIRGQSQAIQSQASSLLADDPALIVRHESDAANSDAGYRQWEGGLAMPLWLPGQRERRFKVAEATAREADATGRLQKWQVAGAIREVLWSLQIAEAELDLAGRAVQSAQHLEADITARVKAGELARGDLILAQKETLAREIELAAALSNRDAVLRHYQHLTGLAAVPADINEDAAAGSAVPDDHPALLAAREISARATANRDQIRAEKRANPVLTLGGKTDRPESGLSYDSALYVEVNVPLGIRSQTALKSADAERSRAEAAAALARAEHEIEHDFGTAIAAQKLAVQSLQLAEHKRQLATEGLRLTQRAFELGESDLFTLLQAHTQALDAERDFNIRRLEQGRAVARVNQALGVIPE